MESLWRYQRWLVCFIFGHRRKQGEHVANQFLAEKMKEEVKV